MGRPRLLTSFTLLVTLLLAADLAVDYRASRREADDRAAFYLAEVHRDLEAEFRRVAGPAQALVRELRAAYRAGRLDPRDPGPTNALLMAFMRIHPEVTSVNTGSDRGEGYLILRRPEGWANRIKRPEEPGRVRWLRLDDRGEPAEETLVDDDYDPRDRPWYRAALAAPDATWTGPYVMRTTRDPGLTVSARLTDPAGPGTVVAGADLLLRDLGQVLGRALPWPQARAYLLGAGGTVVASSDEVSFRRVLEEGPAELPLADEHRFWPLGQAWARGADLPDEPFEVSAEGGRWLAAFGTLALPGLPGAFRLAVLIPRSALDASFRTQGAQTVLLFFGVLAFSSWVFARHYLLPIRRLTREAVGLGRPGAPAGPGTTARDDEVGALERAFRDAAGRIADQQAALAASEARYRRLFEDNPSPCWVCRAADGGVLAANRRALELYGYDRDELLSLRLGDLEAEPAPKGEAAGLRRHRRRDGTEIEVELASTEADWGGEPARVYLARDVTAERSLEEQLRRSQMLEAVGRLAAGVAHDFNNLLQVINGNAELALDSLPEGHRLRSSLRGIGDAGTRAADLTRQLLALGRRQVLRPEPFRLNDVVEDLVSLLRRLLPEDVALATRLEPAPWLVHADPSQLGQVLINLVINARDALPGGGSIRVETANEELSGRPGLADGPYAVLRVADTGSGMSDEVLARAFDPFFTTKEAGRGSGLGLSVVQGIVEQSGGRVLVETAPGRGSTFAVCLPRCTAPREPAPDRGEQPEPTGAGETVLLVEDQDDVRALVRRQLEARGYRVLEAAGGEEALAAARAHAGPVHLLVTDVVMPGLGGRELAERLRRERPETRVLFVSGHPADELARRDIETHRATFLQKPFTAGALARKVAEVLGR